MSTAKILSISPSATSNGDASNAAVTPSAFGVNDDAALPATATAATTLFVDREHDVGYRIMHLSDVESTLEAVVDSFAEGEPLTANLGVTRRDWRNFKMWIFRMAKEGTAVVAFDLHTDEILGAFLNEDFQNTDPTGLEAFLENADGQWGPVMNIISKLEDQLMSKYDIPADPSNRISGEFFHMWMIGVSPKSRGRSVGKNLFLCSCRLAKMRGFRLAFAECTGSLFAHIYFENISVQRYRVSRITQRILAKDATS